MDSVFGAVLVVAMVTALPWGGARTYRKLKAGLLPRARAYRQMLVGQAIFGASALIYAALTGVPGLVLPLRPLPAPLLASWQPIVPGVLVGAAVGLLIPVLIPKLRKRLIDRTGEFSALLPRTPAERWTFAAIAVAAGTCEELLFRGFLWHFLATHLPLGFYGLFGVAAAIFGAAHLYQGVRGILLTALLGAMLLLLFLATGSLVLPMALHVLLDLRALAFAPRSAPEPTQA